jgi:hypothetical protein
MRARCRLRIAALFGSSSAAIALHTSLVVLRKNDGAEGLHWRPRASISSANASVADRSFGSEVTAKRRRSNSHSRTCLAAQSWGSLVAVVALGWSQYADGFLVVLLPFRAGTRSGRSSTRACELIVTIPLAVSRAGKGWANRHKESRRSKRPRRRNFIRKPPQFYRDQVDADGRAGGGEPSIFIEFLYRCLSIHLENIWRKWHLIEARGRSRFSRRNSARFPCPAK